MLHGQEVMCRPISHITGVFTGRGQINRYPGQWSPEWEAVTLVVYEPQQVFASTTNGIQEVTFSVIFKQEVYSYGYMIDFFSINNVPLASGWQRSCDMLKDSAPKVENSFISFIRHLNNFRY